MAVHNCDNCKHKDCWEYADPCDSCTDLTGDPTNWEPQTNAVRIRAMTDEELAAYLGHASLCVTIQGEDGGAWCSQYGDCNECLHEWLRQEAEDAT